MSTGLGLLERRRRGDMGNANGCCLCVSDWSVHLWIISMEAIKLAHSCQNYPRLPLRRLEYLVTSCLGADLCLLSVMSVQVFNSSQGELMAKLTMQLL